MVKQLIIYISGISTCDCVLVLSALVLVGTISIQFMIMLPYLKRLSITLDTTVSTSWCSCSAKSVKLLKITLASSKLSSFKSSKFSSLLSIAVLIDCSYHSSSLLLLLLVLCSCVSAFSFLTSLMLSLYATLDLNEKYEVHD